MNRGERRRRLRLVQKGGGARGGGGDADLAGMAALQEAIRLHQAGRLKEAREKYRRVLRVAPNHPETLNYCGVVNFQLGHIGQAVSQLRKSVALRPDYPEANNNLGNVLVISGDLDGAISAYRRAVDLRPDYSEAHNNLASALHSLGDYEAALAAYRRALEIEPDFVAALNGQGTILMLTGQPEEAMASLRRAIEHNPDYLAAHVNLGNARQAMGDLAGAEKSYRRALQIQPDYAEPYLHMAWLRKNMLRSGDISAMERRLSDPSASDLEVIQLCFALAKILDDKGEYEEAFTYLKRGNRLKRAAITYRVADDERLMERIIGVFDGAFMTRAAAGGCPSETPIFVVGLPRSGTTLVEQILASHSHVFGAGELTDMPLLARGMAAGGRLEFPEAVRGLEANDYGNLGRAYAEAVRRRAPSAGRITDKMPSNFMLAGLIHLILPNARIINCIRNPLDTCFACYRQLFSTSGQDFTYDLTDLGSYYILYDRLMAHWRGVMPGRILDVTYESIVGDQVAATRRILEFCGLPWEDACLAFHRTERPVQTLSSAQVRKPIYSASVESWKRYEPQLEPLKKVLGPLAEYDPALR